MSRSLLVGILFLTRGASAEELASVPGAAMTAQLDVVHGTSPFRELAERILVRFAEAELKSLAAVTRRADSLLKVATTDDDARFDEAARRSGKLVLLTRKLEAQHAAEEEEHFDEAVDRFLEKIEFQAEQDKAESRAFDMELSRFLQKSRFLHALEARRSVRRD
ncbi:MAG TPA: hypothetical protein VHE30_13770 [Polyangiaceae bacterium]|nr:hypothetical protein [Polyangiaceae bacterium]